MSIWSKPVTAITHEDIEQFCLQQEREGVAVDYKREIPTHLPKCVAAFANTVGGALILGVATDAANMPIWPPVGMDTFNTFTERITQQCAAKIYPPILPDIGNLIDNPNRAGSKLAVIRIDQSHESPHAIESGRTIYLRRGDTSDFFDVADVDQIERMLASRRRGEIKAQELLNRHLRRFITFIQRPEEGVAVWWSVCPSAPEGAWGRRKHPTRVLSGSSETSILREAEYNGIGVYGDVIRARRFSGMDAGGCALSQGYLINQSRQFLTDAKVAIVRPAVSYPGMLRVAMGFFDALGARMKRSDIDISTRFPDPEYRAEIITTYQEFAESNFSTPGQWPRILTELLGEVFHAFNVPSAPITA